MLLPWATLDQSSRASTIVRPGTVGLILVALAAGVIAVSLGSVNRRSSLPARISTVLGGLATVVSIVLALRAISTANRLANLGAGRATTSYAVGAALAVVASVTVVAASLARSTQTNPTSPSLPTHP